MKDLKIKVIVFVIISLAFLVSCKPDIVPLIESSTVKVIETKESKELVARETIVKPTIDLESILIESTTKTNKTEETVSKVEISFATVSEVANTIKEQAVKALDMVVETDDRVYHGKEKVETEGWVYGMTPCEWVYVEPGIQLISNYKPNTSKLYSANGKMRTSSGLKGCYIPVFRKTDMMSNTFEGRFYVFDDYTKTTPENMLFDNSLHALKYKNIPVEDILRMGLNIEKTANGLLKVGNEYINIVYVTDLDNILNAKQ